MSKTCQMKNQIKSRKINAGAQGTSFSGLGLTGKHHFFEPEAPSILYTFHSFYLTCMSARVPRAMLYNLSLSLKGLKQKVGKLNKLLLLGSHGDTSLPLHSSKLISRTTGDNCPELPRLQTASPSMAQYWKRCG